MPTPDFIVELRARIGHDLLWLPGVSAAVFDDDGRVLLTRRADTGRWALVGGIPEPGEEPAQAMAREILEETGVEAEVQRLASVAATPVKTYPNGDQVQFLALTFRFRQVGGEARVADDENLDVGWFAMDDLPELDAVAIARLHACRSETGPPEFAR